MIATLSGRLRQKLEDRIVLEVGGVGYEVFLPPTVMRQIDREDAGSSGGALELVIYYHATRDQPRPVLIGFTADLDKEFFEKLITVKDIGPMVAARALAVPVGELASAIARQDEKFLRALPGIGPQKAKNIVAQLHGKVAKFALAREEGAAPVPAAAASPDAEALRELVWEVLVKQLGHRPSEASQLISDALARRPDVVTPEELFEEIYRASPAAPPRRGRERGAASGRGGEPRGGPGGGALRAPAAPALLRRVHRAGAGGGESARCPWRRRASAANAWITCCSTVLPDWARPPWPASSPTRWAPTSSPPPAPPSSEARTSWGSSPISAGTTSSSSTRSIGFRGRWKSCSTPPWKTSR